MDKNTDEALAHPQQPEPNPDLKSLGNRLVGTWEVSGEAEGTVTYKWTENGFFLLQHVGRGSGWVRVRPAGAGRHRRSRPPVRADPVWRRCC